MSLIVDATRASLFQLGKYVKIGLGVFAFLLHREEEDKRQEATAHHFLYEIHTPPSSMHP